MLSCLSVNYCQVGIADSSHRITGWETCHIDCIGGDEDCGGEQIEFGSSGQPWQQASNRGADKGDVGYIQDVFVRHDVEIWEEADQEPTREGGGVIPQWRGSWPEGFDPSVFRCLTCGERTNPPYKARICPKLKSDLVCSYYGVKQSHLEDVCFKKLEAERNLVSRQLDEQQGRAACLPGSKDEKVAGYSQWGGEDNGLLQSQAEQAPGIR